MLRTSTIFITLVLLFLYNSRSTAQPMAFELKTLVIDAGHGGKDPGALIGNAKEKDIVLDVALKTGKIIKERFPNINVIYSRNKDVFIPLSERAELANAKKADLFISIHVNSFKSENISGAETYILGNHRSEENLKVAQMENSVILLEEDYTTRYEGFDPNSAESYIMFELIQNEFLEQSRFFADQLQKSFINKAKRKSRGVRQAGFLVLRQTTMPSVLVELGFISNNNEKKFLTSETGKQKMANSIADAFSQYKNRVDIRSNISFVENKDSSIIPEKKKKKKKNTILEIHNYIQKGNWYAVQILASKKEINIDSPELKSANPVYFLNENGWYKYYIGLTQNYAEAINNHIHQKTKFKSSFIVGFNNGKKDKIISY